MCFETAEGETWVKNGNTDDWIIHHSLCTLSSCNLRAAVSLPTCSLSALYCSSYKTRYTQVNKMLRVVKKTYTVSGIFSFKLFEH